MVRTFSLKIEVVHLSYDRIPPWFSSYFTIYTKPCCCFCDSFPFFRHENILSTKAYTRSFEGTDFGRWEGGRLIPPADYDYSREEGRGSGDIYYRYTEHTAQLLYELCSYRIEYSRTVHVARLNGRSEERSSTFCVRTPPNRYLKSSNGLFTSHEINPELFAKLDSFFYSHEVTIIKG